MANKNPNEAVRNSKTDILNINIRKIALRLGVLALVLVLISLAAQFIKYIGGVEKAYRLIPTMDVDRELSVPSIFSVQMLSFLGLISALIAGFKFITKDRFRFHWAIMALGFLIMSFDEGAMIHELAMPILRNLLGNNLPDFLTFAWVLPGMLIILILTISYMKFFFSLPARVKKGILISGGIYLCGLIGMELVGGYALGEFGIRSLSYNIVVTIEESFEMSGLVLAIYTFLDYFRIELNGSQLRF